MIWYHIKTGAVFHHAGSLSPSAMRCWQTELQLNEWHFTESWQNTPEWKTGMHGINGIDSACAVANILSRWQDSPLTMSNYYTVGTSGGWGIMDVYHRKFKTYFALYAFAQMLDHDTRVKAVSSKPEISILAGKDEKNSEGAILVSDFNSAVKELDLDMNGCSLSGIKVRVLDEAHDLEEIPCEVRKGTLLLKKQYPASLWLVTGLVCQS